MATTNLGVLLIDDFEPWRRKYRALLREDSRFGMICEAGDGAEALEIAGRLQPDLILLDVGLPKVNGIEVARKLEQISPRSRILFVSENHDPEIIEAALNAGARGYLLKSGGLGDVVKAIDVVLTGGTFVGANLLRNVPASEVSDLT